MGLLVFVLMVTACEKNTTADSKAEKLNGRYTGTFNRSGMDTVEVILYFDEDNTFKGTGGRLNYPALCNGSYEQSGNNLTVNNGCTWTANFDWTLIFDGNFTINFTSENSVRIWRTNGVITDEYLLSRFTR